MYMNACELHECLFMHESLCFCAYVYFCVSIHYSPPCILGKLPWAKRKEQSHRNSEGSREGCPREPQIRTFPSSTQEQYPLYTHKVQCLAAISSPSPVRLSPTLSPSERGGAEREKQIPWRTERWKKGLCGVKRQFVGMPKRESNSKQNILLINKKLSLNNAARSPLTPLDLKLASASF